MKTEKWLLCPVCKNKTRIRLRENTELKNFMPAAEKVGLNLYHGSAGRMLRNKKYLGDDYYPAIIDKETFDKAEEIRMSRAKALGRVRELEGKKAILFPTNFTIPAVRKVSDDPFEQAAYAYSLIESEVDGDGTK